MNLEREITDITEYEFKIQHDMGLNILPEYYQILIEYSSRDINKYLEYLYCKYSKNLLRKKISHRKKSATSEYQPITKRYKQIKIKRINPYIWDKYKDLKRISGYSISFIIRIFLEWEMLEKHQSERLERGHTLIERIGAAMRVNYSNFHFCHNYSSNKSGNSQNRSIYIYYIYRFG